jgi:RNA processing factor Prp31
MNISAVKYKFLHCNKQKEVIEQMYGNEFDNLVPNIKKYIAFWHKVIDDDRVEELNNILESMKDEQLIDKVYEAYCKACGHFAHTTPIETCRQYCQRYEDFKQIIK